MSLSQVSLPPIALQPIGAQALIGEPLKLPANDDLAVAPSGRPTRFGAALACSVAVGTAIWGSVMFALLAAFGG